MVALVQEYVSLKKVGASFKGLCPFHNEKTPSFHVHPARGFYYCFGCQASGDAIRFLMSIEGRAFPDAVRALAERGGIEIPIESGPEDQAIVRARQREQRRMRVMDIATSFFEEALRSESGDVARAELVRRGITDETSSAFPAGLRAAWLGSPLEGAGSRRDVAGACGGAWSLGTPEEWARTLRPIPPPTDVSDHRPPGSCRGV